jgi:bisphosphoglycerate-dependent phosphoglycerate mutase
MCRSCRHGYTHKNDSNIFYIWADVKTINIGASARKFVKIKILGYATY